MARSMTQLGQDPVFEHFLGASIGEDSHGIDVTVLSMFARLGVNPWTEASELAAMPEGIARKRLDALLTRFEDVPTIGPDRVKIISAIMAFLPRKRVFASASSQDDAKSLVPLFNIPIYQIIAAFLFLGWIANLAQGQ